jgi:hypothetical protein
MNPSELKKLIEVTREAGGPLWEAARHAAKVEATIGMFGSLLLFAIVGHLAHLARKCEEWDGDLQFIYILVAVICFILAAVFFGTSGYELLTLDYQTYRGLIAP